MMYLLRHFAILGFVAIATSQELFCNAPLTFFIPDVQTNWIGAVEYCNRIGMRLAVVDSEYKHTEIIRLAQTSNVFNPTVMHLWIGANDLAKEGRFVWHATGVELDFTQWKVGEPNNGQQIEHCVHLWYQPANMYYWGWNDVVCTNTFNFVCENVPRVQ